jgi:hypothetical protein
MLYNATRFLGDGKLVIVWQRVRRSVRAVSAIRITPVILTKTRVVADVAGTLSLLTYRYHEIFRTSHLFS